MIELRKQYPEIHRMCNESGGGFRYALDPRKTMEVPEEERLAFWESIYNQRGFAKWLGSFADHLTDREANQAYSDFHANKIRQRLDDPVIADKLIPKNHGFGTRRVPMETNYFEVYNRPNVRLVDFTADSPIERISKKGVVLSSGEEIELDLLIYATGFDAITGSLTRGIDLRGVDGQSLTEKWEGGIETFLGLFIKDFPNFAMIMGPHQAFGNIPRSIEFAVESITRFIKYCRDNEITFAEPRAESVKRWTVGVSGLIICRPALTV
jgi:cation diffusion facilitator CzcD-associated flavoprotein CzcO